MADHTAAPECDRFVPAIVDPPVATALVLETFDWFSAAAVITWLVIGAWPLWEMVRGHFGYGGGGTYLLSFALYGAALLVMLFLPRRRRLPSRWVPIVLALLQTVTSLAMNVITTRYIHGSGAGMGLLVIIAAELPYFLSSTFVWAWIAIQTLVLTAIYFPSFPAESLTIGVAIAGFQIFASASTILALNEGRARTNLARANAELHATRALLEENSRNSERLRISRDLHDTLGHHLTALSVRLDVASRLSDDVVSEHIHQAHAITRLLLSDVRDAVSTLRETSRLDLAAAIRALAMQPIGATLHLDIPGALIVEDANRAEAILRAVQEVLTNTARHAHAGNLWLRLEAGPAGVALHARDDGSGASAFTPGNGLRGMRERFEQYGGQVDAGPALSGFEVRAVMPIRQSA